MLFGLFGFNLISVVLLVCFYIVILHFISYLIIELCFLHRVYEFDILYVPKYEMTLTYKFSGKDLFVTCWTLHVIIRDTPNLKIMYYEKFLLYSDISMVWYAI
jgi:hypothetical protein